MKPVIVSFPRAGRTWLLTLIGLTTCHYKGLPIEQAMVERKKLVDATHDKTDKSLKVHADDLKMDPDFMGKKVLFLRRDPRDILVSAHLHATKRKGNYEGTLSEYIRDPRYGIAKIRKFTDMWFENQWLPESFMTISYERLLLHTEDELTDICRFLRIPWSEESIDKAVLDATIENLREKEASGFFIEGVGKPKHPEDIDTYYHRKGGSGGYVNYMTKEDIAYCREYMHE